jgi:hypothetical protein
LRQPLPNDTSTTTPRVRLDRIVAIPDSPSKADNALQTGVQLRLVSEERSSR